MDTLYILRDPHDDQVRYVGVTSQPLAQRLYSHISDAIRCPASIRRAKRRWVADLHAQGLAPIIEALGIVEPGHGDLICRLEEATMAHYRSIGAPLLNVQRTARSPESRNRKVSSHVQ